MDWLRGLHIVEASIYEHVRNITLQSVAEINTANAWIIIGSDIQVLDKYVDCREFPVQRVR